jgi:hypothetical protein
MFFQRRNTPVKQYERLIKPLSMGRMSKGIARALTDPQEPWADGPGNTGQKIWLNGQYHFEGRKLNFHRGIYNSPGEWYTGKGPHTHPYPECYVFSGLATANINYLGAEIEFCLGREQETYSFNESTTVVIPAGLPHGPIVTKRIFSPKGFDFSLVSLAAVSTTTWSNEGVKPIKSTGKYAHLIKPLKPGLLIERGKINPSRLAAAQSHFGATQPGPAFADHLISMESPELEGLNLNFVRGFYSRSGIWLRGASAPDYSADEVMVFMGTDPCHIDYLGAEIEIDLGPEPERYLINKPSAVICPSGFSHQPIVTRWVDRPYVCMQISLAK